MICQFCKTNFDGRPNKKYCSPDCKRKAEFEKRREKRAIRPKKEVMKVNAKNLWNDLPTLEEMFGNLKTWGEIEYNPS